MESYGSSRTAFDIGHWGSVDSKTTSTYFIESQTGAISCHLTSMRR